MTTAKKRRPSIPLRQAMTEVERLQGKLTEAMKAHEERHSRLVAASQNLRAARLRIGELEDQVRALRGAGLREMDG